MKTNNAASYEIIFQSIKLAWKRMSVEPVFRLVLMDFDDAEVKAVIGKIRLEQFVMYFNLEWMSKPLQIWNSFREPIRTNNAWEGFHSFLKRRNTVGNAVRRFEETGSNKNRIGQGRPRSARDEENVAAAAIAITAEPSTKFNSTRKLGKKMAISRDSAHRILVEDLGLKPYKMLSRQELGLAHIIKRLQRCRGMRRSFTDEKIFTIEQAHNKQNDRVWMKELPAIEERLVTHEQHPQQVMVFAAICFNGKMPLVFADPDFSYNQAYYRQRILRHAVKPWAEEFFGEEQWTFQQDGAPMHTATLTQDWLRRNFPNFIDKNEWPPRSLISIRWTFQFGQSLKTECASSS
uniref:Transposase n=1 Tax=Ditylenchus dipsaci TaxID=166011 RepID=A0A915E498_9BILA